MRKPEVWVLYDPTLSPHFNGSKYLVLDPQDLPHVNQYRWDADGVAHFGGQAMSLSSFRSSGAGTCPPDGYTQASFDRLKIGGRDKAMRWLVWQAR